MQEQAIYRAYKKADESESKQVYPLVYMRCGNDVFFSPATYTLCGEIIPEGA